MSVAEAAHRPAARGRAVALWLAFLLIIAAGIGLAWYGAGSLRPEVTSSGLQFRTIKAGTGETDRPQRRRADGLCPDRRTTARSFDTSENHGGPQPFTMDRSSPASPRR